MIWKREWKKLLKHPMMWCLFGIFMMFNGFLLWEVIGDDGEVLRGMHEELLTDGVDEAFYQEKENLYDSLDMIEVKNLKQEMYHYYPTGHYKEFIDKRYERLNERVKEIIQNKEADGISYPGSIFRLHNKLYVKVLRWVFLEMGLLILFAVLFLMDYERMNRTTGLVYSSTIGRRLQWIKWCVGVWTGIGFGVLLLGIMLMIWFLLIPYQGFWDTSVSSAIMAEPRGMLLYPFITFHKMTIAQYLLATILMGVLLVFIIGMMVGVVQLITNNSYFSFILIVLFFMAGLCISGISTESWLDIVISWNPADLWYRMGSWFMEGSLVSSFEGAEITNVIVLVVFWLIVGKKAYQYFMKKDY